MKDNYLEFQNTTKEYKTYTWKTAIGLQKVDNLSTSIYLNATAQKNIDGDISLKDAEKLIHSYYKENKINLIREEQADKVSINIAKALSKKTFKLSPIEYISIHKELFTGIFNHAGKLRDYNFIKEEWILNGDTVLYGDSSNLKEVLEYDFQIERNFSYIGLTNEEIISHIAKFISNLWQIHIFSEGNTRVTAVFLIKYLTQLGFNITNEIFAENSWYFRNALVRSNYNNRDKNIYATTYYLELFLRNLLLNEKNTLSNRELHIDYVQPISSLKEKNTYETSILNLIEEKPSISINELAIKLNRSPRTIKNIIKSLKEKNLVERIGGKKNGYWKIKK